MQADRDRLVQTVAFSKGQVRAKAVSILEGVGVPELVKPTPICSDLDTRIVVKTQH